MITKESLNIKRSLSLQGQSYGYYSLDAAEEKGLPGLSRLPFSLKVVIENLLRRIDDHRISFSDIQKALSLYLEKKSGAEISFMPARVLMQDFTGVPAVVDLAAMRDAMTKRGGNPESINPLIPVDLVIDHSVIVDHYGTSSAFQENVSQEFARNQERYTFLRWGQTAFKNFRVVPPGTGICHQVNLEYLAQVVWTSTDDDGTIIAYPDTLIGTDSHTTMVNGLAVLGWGVGGIEAEAAMLGQPLSMLIPDVIGFKLVGQPMEGITATDLVLTITHLLRAKGVVGKFVEFYGEGLNALSLADRATIANMAPEYGATCGYFPIDEETIRYLTFTGRDPERVALVEAYAKAQGLWRESTESEPLFTDSMVLDLSTVRPSLAGPKRPQDQVFLEDAPASCHAILAQEKKGDTSGSYPVESQEYALHEGDIVIAAITSCTNTSNPAVLMAAGLLARKAAQKGLKVKPWVKTSLAPGSQVVTDYLRHAGLLKDLEDFGFYLVGYGCTTCIGNSGPLIPSVAKTIEDNELTVCSVLSGNRNFEGRVHAQIKANYLASPPLVVAYAIAGSMRIHLLTEALGNDQNGNPVYLKDIWPSNAEIQAAITEHLTPELFQKRYADVFKGGSEWQKIETHADLTYTWDDQSTYVKNPPYFVGKEKPGKACDEKPKNIEKARILAILGDSVTTDHISPAGTIKPSSPAGTYLQQHGVSVADFNAYGARRGNHEVMMRGTFANVRLSNEMVPETKGGWTKYYGENSEEMSSIYDAAMRYQSEKTPLVIFAGKEYGTGSSRDWAAKGTNLLGVKAVIAESFERIHRSNLVGMGVLPLVYGENLNRKILNLKGDEYISLEGFDQGITPKMEIRCIIQRANGEKQFVPLICRIDTEEEVEYFRHGGILPFVLETL